MNPNTSNDGVPPKVFISYASEDRERFVESFAKRLRAQGVDVWLDRWEISAGDDLIRRIFDEGLKEAGAVLVVVSPNSVKDWVRAELSVIVAEHINRRLKVIPVVLDNAETPMALKALCRVNINNPESYDEDFESIKASIFGHSLKPEIGAPPAYTLQKLKAEVEGDPTDELVLKLSGDHVIECDESRMYPSKVFPPELGLAPAALKDCMEILDRKGILKVSGLSGHVHYRLTNFGMEKYALTYLPDYVGWVEALESLVVNEGVLWSNEIQKRLNAPQQIVEHILRRLDERGDVELSQEYGVMHINTVGASLRRRVASR